MAVPRGSEQMLGGPVAEEHLAALVELTKRKSNRRTTHAHTC